MSRYRADLQKPSELFMTPLRARDSTGVDHPDRRDGVLPSMLPTNAIGSLDGVDRRGGRSDGMSAWTAHSRRVWGSLTAICPRGVERRPLLAHAFGRPTPQRRLA